VDLVAHIVNQHCLKYAMWLFNHEKIVANPCHEWLWGSSAWPAPWHCATICGQQLMALMLR